MKQGYVGTIVAKHECPLPHIFMAKADKDFRVGDVWECWHCKTKWVMVRSWWRKEYWVRYIPQKHGVIA